MHYWLILKPDNRYKISISKLEIGNALLAYLKTRQQVKHNCSILKPDKG